MKKQASSLFQFLIITVMILGVSVSVAMAAPTWENLLTNPGFEDYLVEGWGDAHPPWGRGNKNSDPAPYEGNHYLKLTTMVPGATISQEVDLVALGFDSNRLASGGYQVRVEGAMYTGNTDSAGIISLGQHIRYQNKDEYVETEVAQRKSADWKNKSHYVSLLGGANKLVYKFQAVNSTSSDNQAYLDSASLKMCPNAIWCFDDRDTLFQSFGDVTTDDDLVLDGDCNNICQVSVTHGKTWTSNGQLTLTTWYAGRGQVNVNSGTWQANNRVVLGNYGTAKVKITDNGTWNSTSDVILTLNTQLHGRYAEAHVDIVDGQWNSSGTVHIGNEMAHFYTTVAIKPNGIWNSLGEVRTAETNADDLRFGMQIDVEGGTWNSSKTYIGIKSTVDPAKIRITNNGLWTTSDETVLGCTSASRTEVTVENGQFISDGPVYFGVGRTSLEIKDNGIWTANEYVTIGESGSGSVTNSGLFDMTGGMTIGEKGLLRVTTGGTAMLRGELTNNGSILLEGGLLALGHSGTLRGIDVQGGTLSILGTDTILDVGDYTLIADCTMRIGQGGTVLVDSGKFLHINGTLEMPNGDGTIQLNNSTLTCGGNQVLLGGGTIEGSGQIFVGAKGLDLGVDGAITGTSTSERLAIWGNVSGSGELTNVTLYGDLDVGNSPGSIEVGGLALSSSGSLTMELGGLVPGTEYDQILVSGTFTLDGTLEVLWYNGFEASAGDTFTLFDVTASGSLDGQFDNILLPTFTDSSLHWDTSNLYTDGTISAVPEPMTWVLLLGLGAMAFVRRRIH